MKLLILSGFLGVGKTSILLPFVKQLAAKGKKVAIIENEIGEKGVDDLYLKENDLQVKEIYSGCICCNLRDDLICSLSELAKECKPDVIVMEPTGVAGPYQLLSTVGGYRGDLESKTLVSIVDAERFDDITGLDIPIVIEGIQSADLIALNKVDLIQDDHLERVRKKIKQTGANSPIYNVSASDEKSLKALFEAIETELFRTERKEEALRFTLKKKGIAPTVYSKTFELTEDEIAMSELEIKKYFEDRIYRIALLLKEAGADLIGNLKLIIKSDLNGYILVSGTSFNWYPTVTGQLASGFSRVSFNLNAMIYGIEKDDLDSIITRVFPHQFK